MITDDVEGSNNAVNMPPFFNGQQQGDIASCIKTRWVVCNCLYLPGCHCERDVCKCRHCVAMRTSIRKE